MSEKEFFDTTSRRKVREAIESVEAQTSAELVVAVRKESGKYRHVDVASGAGVAFIVLLLLLFLPWSFDVVWMPLEVLGGFILGYLVTWLSWSLKRMLLCKRIKQQTTWRMACTLFYEKGMSCTSARNAVLVMVSMMERRVEVVTDIGIDVKKLGQGWLQSVQALDDAVSKYLDFDAFLKALTSLGPVLGAQMPRQQDDVNELPDEPDVL